MPSVSASEFLEGVRTSRLLDDALFDELRSRPEAAWGDVSSLATFAQSRGWLTPFQISELSEGRGDRLNFNGYRIFDHVDSGTYGSTYKALHPAVLQPVSLRILKSEWLTPGDNATDYVYRVQAASLIQSPHLANVLDAGAHEGAPFVVQEFVDGCDLFRMVNEMGALPLGLACEYTRQAATALQVAHEKGLVHGDVSPHNLLLTPVKRTTGTNGDVSIRPRPGASIKVVEFGLSPRRPSISEMTIGDSDRLGSLPFSAPERWISGERSAAGDLYGLGASLYFLLSTRPPHAGDHTHEVLWNLQNAPITPIESIKPDLPPEVTQLIGRMLDANPYSRPNVSEVISTIQPFCERLAAPIPQEILVAQETFTQVNVPDAVPVARNLDDPNPYGESLAEEIPPSHDGPLVEPMSSTSLGQHSAGMHPEVSPLDGHHDESHLDGFGHSALGADTPRAIRPKTKATKKNMVWLVAGLCLHASAVLLLIGYLTNWFSFSSPTTQPEQKEERKDTRTKGKGKKN